MKNRSFSKLSIFIIILFLISLSGCSKIFYGNANTSGPASYIPVPSAEESTEDVHFIGGGFSHSHPQRAYFQDEYYYFGSFNYTFARRMKSHVILVNLTGYKGDYQVEKIYEAKGKKSFWGTGAKIEYLIVQNEDNIKFHYGGRISLFYEGGQYRNFRNDSKLVGLWEYDVGNYHRHAFVTSVGGSAGISYQGNNFELGVSAFAGLDPMLILITEPPDEQLGFNFHFTLYNTTLAIETNKSRLNGYLFKTGLYYRL